MTDPGSPGPQNGIEQQTSRLADRIRRAMAPHGGKRDSFLHNGSTMAAMAATTAATVIPADHAIWARCAAGTATFLIAVARALDFGARWRWHLNMRARYAILLDRVDRVALLPVEGRSAALVQIYDDLSKVRSSERGIPGSGTASGAPPSST